MHKTWQKVLWLVRSRQEGIVYELTALDNRIPAAASGFMWMGRFLTVGRNWKNKNKKRLNSYAPCFSSRALVSLQQPWQSDMSSRSIGKEADSQRWKITPLCSFINNVQPQLSTTHSWRKPFLIRSWWSVHSEPVSYNIDIHQRLIYITRSCFYIKSSNMV